MLPHDFEQRNPQIEFNIKEGQNYDPWKAPRLTLEKFADLKSNFQLRYIASLGHLAMNTHNCQPWAFRPDAISQSIKVYLDKGKYYQQKEGIVDKRRVLPESDKSGRQSCISVGCAIGNIKAASRYFGLAVNEQIPEKQKEDVKPILEPDEKELRYVKLAELRLYTDQKPEQVVNRKLFESIFTRRVTRAEYISNLHIDNSIVEQLRESAERNEATLTLLATDNLFDRTRIQVIAQAQLQADTYVVNDDSFRNELGKWFKLNDTVSFLGMPGDTFGLPNEQTLEAYEGLTGTTEQKVEDLAGFAVMGKKGIESSPLVGIISVKDDTPEQWIKAGINLQEIALIMEANQLSLTVHAGLAEVDWVSRSIIKPLTLKGEKPVILFRAGKSIESRPHSPRLPFNEVILD